MGFTIEPVKEIIKKKMWIWQKKKRAGGRGERFQEMNLGEIQELTDTTPEEFTEDNLMKMTASEPVPDDEEYIKEAMPVNKLTLGNLIKRLQLFKTAFDLFYDMDPSMIQAPILKQIVEGPKTYKNIFRQMKKQKCQAGIMMYFCKVTLSMPASPASPSSSFIFSPSATQDSKAKPSSSSSSSAYYSI